MFQISFSYKINNIFVCVCVGVGAKKGRDEDWIQHQDTFDQILAGLNSTQSSKKGDSIEGTASKSILETAEESKRIT